MIKKKENKNFLFGKVISNKINKTLIVLVKKIVKHKLYGKMIIKFKKYFVHNEKIIVNVGDKIKFFKCRPISKKKHWIIKCVL